MRGCGAATATLTCTYMTPGYLKSFQLLFLAQAVLNIVVFEWSMQWKLCAREHLCTNQALEGGKKGCLLLT